MSKRQIQKQKRLKCRASCISLLLVFGLLLSQGVTTAYAVSGSTEEPAGETVNETAPETEPAGETAASTETEPAGETVASTEPEPAQEPVPVIEEPVAVASAPGIDWSKIPSYGGADAVTNWSVAKGDGGYYLRVTESWDYGNIFIKDANGSPINGAGCQLNFTNGTVTNAWSQPIDGAAVQRELRDGKFCYEVFVPASAFPEGGFQLTCGNSVVKSGEIPSTDGSTGETEPSTEPSTEPEESSEPSTEPAAPAGYNGIVIDGNFDDWAAVSKTDVNENKGWDTVDHVAMVWDGDYIYLYFDAMGTDQGWAVTGNWDSVCGAGPHNNGQYAITTDLGNQLLVQLKNANGTPAVSGIDGATAAVNNTAWDKAPHCWEVRIPASKLPAYKDTISFGFYLVDPLIKDVANLQAGGSGGTFNGIVIDGRYEDWAYYPHTTIQYATSGTHERVVDSRGALWNNGGKLYAHAETVMPAHLEEAGGEFTQAVTIKINNSTDLEFAPRFIGVDGAGNINWNPPRSALADGEYEYYMVSLDAPGTSRNINNLTPGDEIYGRMKVTVGDTMDSCEWEMDVAMLAKHLRPNVEGTVITEIDPSDIRTISVQWGRLGREWVTTAGTSTGALLGITLCLGVCAVPAALIYRKRKGQP